MPSIRSLATDRAPQAIGAYSQGVDAQPFVFVSGQLGLDPTTGELVPGGAAQEAERALANVEAILAAASLGFGHVARMAIYLTDMATFAEVNAVYARVLGNARPARVTVGIAALPRGACVEIEALAVRA